MIAPDTLRTKFFAVHYQKAKGKDEWVDAWRYIDFYRPDHANYILNEKFLKVTDLNGDSLGEATFLYREEVNGIAQVPVNAVMMVNTEQYENEHFIVQGEVPAMLSDNYDDRVQFGVNSNAGLENFERYEDFASNLWNDHNKWWKEILEGN